MSDDQLVLVEASFKDAHQLNEFFTSVPVRGEINVKIQREDHFFSFYERLGIPFKTYIIKDGRDIVGTASFIFRNLIFKTRTLKLAQACDLRISSNRKAVLSWSKFFHPLLEKLRDIEEVDGFITSINQTETQAMNAFIRPKLKRALQPQYSLARSYNLVSIHGFFPLINPPNKNINVRPFLPADKKKLIDYLIFNCKKIDYIPSEFVNNPATYINNSLLYSWGQFLIAFDPDDNIVGCVHPLSSSLLQDYLPQDYNAQSHNLRQFLKMAQILGFGRRLTRPFSRSQQQETLRFKLLHFLISNHSEVFNALIRGCYTHSSQNEFLMYAYEISDYKKRPPKGSIYSEIPYGLYAIETHDRAALPELSLLNTRPAWLDFVWF